MRTPPGIRFWAKVDQSAYGCWEWTGARNNGGYGCFTVSPGRVMKAHRFAHEFLVGPIPDGLQIDHLCRNRACVRPDHLEPVTPRTNVLRGLTFAAMYAEKTHCPHGHPYDEANTYRTSGRRYCRACREDRRAEKAA